MNLKTVWTEGDFALLMSEEPEGYSGNRKYYGYELRYKGTPIFQGSDYSPSPLHGPHSKESIANLLGFLSVKPGDVDPEYFEDYTPDQMRFVTEHGEELSVHVYDLEALVNSYLGRATGWLVLLNGKPVARFPRTESGYFRATEYVEQLSPDDRNRGRWEID